MSPSLSSKSLWSAHGAKWNHIQHGHLSCSHIGHDFQDGGNNIHLFDDLSFTLAANTIMAISGASGSGKSTLLAILVAYCNPVMGRFVITIMLPKKVVSGKTFVKVNS